MVKRNIVANVLGRGWTLLMSFAFIPVYVRFLGIEAYGLIGFVATLQMLTSVMDFGLSTTINRELARGGECLDEPQRTRDLVRTLEIIYWCIGAIMAATVVFIAPWIARHWLNAKGLPVNTVENAIILVGLIIAFQWPSGIYSGGLMGLQRQVLNNLITSSIGTVRGVGAIIVLWLISPTIETYFIWQIVVSALGTAVLAVCLWKTIPKSPYPASFRLPLLRSLWRFAGGMTGISVVTLFLTQGDKILLSALLPLEVFGYYTLAGTLSSGTLVLVGPIFTAVFPRFSQLVAVKDWQSLEDLYHKACQLASTVLLPLMATITFFSSDVLYVWTGNATIAEHAHLIATLLVIGSSLNGLMHMPYAMQLAYGWTSLALVVNTASAMLLVPLIVTLATKYGAVGAAVVWVLLNIGYVVVSIPIMHRRLLQGHMLRWYLSDVGRPMAASVLVALLGRWLRPEMGSKIETFAYVVGVGLLAFLATVIVTPQVRSWTIFFVRHGIGLMFRSVGIRVENGSR